MRATLAGAVLLAGCASRRSAAWNLERRTSEAPSTVISRSASSTLCSKSTKAGTPETTGKGSSAYRQDAPVQCHWAPCCAALR